MVKNNNRGESSVCIAFTAIIVEHKESTGLLRHAPFAIIDRPCGRLSCFLVRHCRASLGGATQKPTGLLRHAPPLKPIWRQAS